MPSVKTNIVANFVGRGVTALTSLLVMPVYIHYLGIEAYGMVGFFVLLLSLVGILDFGLSPTVNRELARLSMQADAGQQARDLVRTLEIIYWCIGIAIGLAVVAGAGIIGRKWIKPETLSFTTVRTSLILIGVVLAAQWPLSFYEGGLIGLQKLVVYNATQSVLQIVRALGAVAVLRFISPTIVAFFTWQAVVSALGVVAVAIVLWRSLPAGGPPRFSAMQLRNVWRFAAGLSLTYVLTLALTQADKLVLSKKLTLSDFGYYNLAFVVGSSLNYLIYPISGGVFPRLSQQAAAGQDALVARTYHAGCQLITVVTAPAALILVAFAPEIMLLWTRDPVTVQHTTTLVRIVMLGTLINGFMNLPYMLQLAYGWTRLAFYVNCVALVTEIPILLWAVARYGAVGAASIWLGLNVMGYTVAVNFMYRRLLTRERWRWYLQDTMLPTAAAGAVVAAARLLLPPMPASLTVPALLTAGAAAATAAALVAPASRAAMTDLAATLRARIADQ